MLAALGILLQVWAESFGKHEGAKRAIEDAATKSEEFQQQPHTHSIEENKAASWYADEWGNTPTMLNVSFTHRHFKARPRIAIVQTGMYNSWFWKPTIDMVVKPAVADGWEVDYFGYFQRGHASRFGKGEDWRKFGHRRVTPWYVTLARKTKQTKTSKSNHYKLCVSAVQT